MTTPALDLIGLRSEFRIGGQWHPAVRDLSLTLMRDETLALVGESGCGKSTAARALLRLIEPDAGRVTWKGEDVLVARGASLKALRRRMQIVFQDP